METKQRTMNIYFQFLTLDHSTLKPDNLSSQYNVSLSTIEKDIHLIKEGMLSYSYKGVTLPCYRIDYNKLTKEYTIHKANQTVEIPKKYKARFNCILLYRFVEYGLQLSLKDAQEMFDVSSYAINRYRITLSHTLKDAPRDDLYIPYNDFIYNEELEVFQLI